jgi:hypothetical protein
MNIGIREDWLLLFLYLCVEKNSYGRRGSPGAILRLRWWGMGGEVILVDKTLKKV